MSSAAHACHAAQTVDVIVILSSWQQWWQAGEENVWKSDIETGTTGSKEG